MGDTFGLADMYRTVAAAASVGGLPIDSGEDVVSLDQVPRWSDADHRLSSQYENEDPSFSNAYFADPLTSYSGAESSSNGLISRFPFDREINSKIYLWRGNPWNLEVDAVVNSTNEVVHLQCSISCILACSQLKDLALFVKWEILWSFLFWFTFLVIVQ